MGVFETILKDYGLPTAIIAVCILGIIQLSKLLVKWKDSSDKSKDKENETLKGLLTREQDENKSLIEKFQQQYEKQSEINKYTSIVLEKVLDKTTQMGPELVKEVKVVIESIKAEIKNIDSAVRDLKK